MKSPLKIRQFSFYGSGARCLLKFTQGLSLTRGIGKVTYTGVLFSNYCEIEHPNLHGGDVFVLSDVYRSTNNDKSCNGLRCLVTVTPAHLDNKFGKPHREPVCRAAEGEATRIAEIVAAKAAADSAEAVERCSANPTRNSASAARNSASAALFSGS